VAAHLAASPTAAPEYELLRWQQFTRKDPPPPVWNLRLPVSEGGFVEPVIGGYEPDVRFSAIATADGRQRVNVKVTDDDYDGRQRVNVKVTDDDYVIYAAYVTDGTKVVPESFRIWGPTSALVAVFPAFVLTVVLSRLVRRWRERAKVGKADGAAGA